MWRICCLLQLFSTSGHLESPTCASSDLASHLQVGLFGGSFGVCVFGAGLHGCDLLFLKF